MRYRQTMVPWCRRAITAATILPILVADISAQTADVRTARDIQLRIESERASYRVGDSIRVRLTFRNASAYTVRYGTAPHIYQARLQVYDEAGRLVEPSIPSNVTGRLGGPERQFKPGAEFTLKSQGLRNEWLNLQDWGYDLREPGRYRIVGTPSLNGRYLTADGAAPSNEVTITVEP